LKLCGSKRHHGTYTLQTGNKKDADYLPFTGVGKWETPSCWVKLLHRPGATTYQKYNKNAI